MNTSKTHNGNSYEIERILEELSATTDQIQALLETVHASKTEFAVLKVEIKVFTDIVQELSDVIKTSDTGMSLLTRIALLEQSLKALENWKAAEINIQNENNSSVLAAEKTGKWQLIVAVATGFLALLTAVLHIIFNIMTKH